MNLYIKTLGTFDIKAGNQSLLRVTGRTYKLYKLFQYFITFRNKKLLPEAILENLWSESESVDPKNMLRTQIFRLRNLIKELLPDDEDLSKYLNIHFINGYYCLEVGPNTVIDVDEFESLVNQLDDKDTYGTERDITQYEKVLTLYKGLYLSDNAYEVWLVPARNYYHRLYLKTLFRLINILKNREDYERIISLCEESLLIEPYEEMIHYYLIEAMMKLGQIKSAISHYDYTVSLLDKEMGTRPSAELTGLIKRFQDNSFHNTETDIYNIRDTLDDTVQVGAMYCEFEYFKFLFNIQKRKSLRDNENDYLCIVNLYNSGNYNNKESGKLLKSLTPILENSLRKGDVFTYWNNNQILILLHNVKSNGMIKIKERIRNNIKLYTKINNVDIRFTTVLSDIQI